MSAHGCISCRGCGKCALCGNCRCMTTGPVFNLEDIRLATLSEQQLKAENKQLKEDLDSALMKISDRDFRIKMLEQKNRGLSILLGDPEP